MPARQVPGTITVSIFNTNPSGNNGGVPLQLGKLNLLRAVRSDLGTSQLQIDPVDPTEGGLMWTKDDGSVQITRLLGDYNFNGFVNASDYVIWRKQSSINGTGGTNETGYTIWRENFGASLPGAGTGAAIAGASLSDSRPVSPSNSTSVSPQKRPRLQHAMRYWQVLPWALVLPIRGRREPREPVTRGIAAERWEFAVRRH